MRPDGDGSRSSSDDHDFFPTGEPPTDPAEDETAAPDRLPDADRWPTMPRPFGTGPASPVSAGAPPKPPNRPSSDRWHAELETTTDHQLIAAINAEYLTEDVAA